MRTPARVVALASLLAGALGACRHVEPLEGIALVLLMFIAGGIKGALFNLFLGRWKTPEEVLWSRADTQIVGSYMAVVLGTAVYEYFRDGAELEPQFAAALAGFCGGFFLVFLLPASWYRLPRLMGARGKENEPGE